MAITFLAREVSDLCVGKPPLKSLPSTTSTVADALFALKRSGEIYVSLWSCDHSVSAGQDVVVGPCRCVGKICMVDVILYLCKQENLSRPLDALQANVLDLIPKSQAQIRHLERNSSLLEAIDYLLEGVQNLVIPIQSNARARRKQQNKPSPIDTLHNGQEFCWLTQEDVVRFLLDSIGVFSPIPTFTIEALNIVDEATLTIHYNAPASSALSLISRALLDRTSIAVVNEDNQLVGEISPLALACCDETVAAAIATLSARDLMAYIEYGGPSEDLVHLVKMRLQERNLTALLELMDDCYNPSTSSCSSCSSDEELGTGKNGMLARNGRRSEAIVCRPWNTLMAVMVQMIAHRVGYAWVIEEDNTLVGIVTLAEILKQFRSTAGAGVREKLKEIK